MTLLSQAWQRLRAIVVRGTLESDMQDEMREHVERATQRYLQRGMPLHEARLAARREFGNRMVLEEEGRDARGARWMDALAGDLRFALRYFVRHKATVAIVVAVLAIGTGANTLIFTIYRAEFVRPAPGVAEDPSHARLHVQDRRTQTSRWEKSRFTLAELAALEARKDVFSDVAGWAIDDVIFDGQAADSADARGIEAHFVTSNYFRTAGTRLAAGQGLAQSSDASDVTAVMGHAIAEQLYGSPAAAIGRRILVNEVPVRVVGVAPPRFQGVIRMDDGELWMPINARATILHVDPRSLQELHALGLLARRAPGVTHEEATAFARTAVTATLPDSAARVGMARAVYVQEMMASPPSEVSEGIAASIAIFSIGVLILLVAWMNVSSLMVAAAVARRHEIAVRLSLGASRLRLLRQLVTETTLLAVLGGTLGLVLSWWGLSLMAKLDPNGLTAADVVPDAGTLAFVVIVSVATGLIFGLSPALHATRAGVANALRDSGAGASSRSRLQRVFVGAQIALSQPLLVFLGILLSLMIADYEPYATEMSRQVISVGLRPLAETGAPGQRIQAVDALVQRLATRPEVAGAVQEATGFDVRGIVVQDRESARAASDTAPTIVTLEGAAPGWFAVVDVPIIFGRDVELADTIGAERNIVIGSDLAQRLWGGANPVGRRLASPPLPGVNTDSATLTVVGVYDATRALPEMTWGGGMARGDKMPRVYTAHGNAWRRDGLLVRTRGPAAPYIPELHRVLRAEVPSIPVTRVMTLEQVDEDKYESLLRMAGMAAAGGIAALLLASLGLYGVVSLAVQQRVREIGIRIAVGAHPQRVARMFVSSGVRLSVIALGIGLPVSLAALKVAVATGAMIVPGVNPWLLGAVIAVILIAVAAAATWIPARRAALVDPARTLRVE